MQPQQAQGPPGGLRDADIKQLREVFDLMDKDKGGTLTASEVHELLGLLGMPLPRAEVAAMVDAVDADGSGAVDFEEFLQVAAKPAPLAASRADLLRAFRMFAGADASPGTIRPDALEAALLQHCQGLLESAEISRLVHSLHTTPGGSINYAELVSLATVAPGKYYAADNGGD